MKTPRIAWIHILTYLLTYLLTPWCRVLLEKLTNWFAASQEIPRISRKPKVHYRTHKRPPPVSILGQPNPIHIPTSHLLEIHPNIIHPSTPRSPQWSPSLGRIRIVILICTSAQLFLLHKVICRLHVSTNK